MPSSMFEVPAPVKVLLTNAFSGDKAGHSDSKVILISASERRDQIKALTDFMKPYALLELDIADHDGFKRLMTRIQWKERIDVVIHLPRHLDFRSSAYYDFTLFLREFVQYGIRNFIVIGAWETARDAPKELRDFAEITIELYSRGYTIKVNE